MKYISSKNNSLPKSRRFKEDIGTMGGSCNDEEQYEWVRTLGSWRTSISSVKVVSYIIFWKVAH